MSWYLEGQLLFSGNGPESSLQLPPRGGWLVPVPLGLEGRVPAKEVTGVSRKKEVGLFLVIRILNFLKTNTQVALHGYRTLKFRRQSVYRHSSHL